MARLGGGVGVSGRNGACFLFEACTWADKSVARMDKSRGLFLHLATPVTVQETVSPGLGVNVTGVARGFIRWCARLIHLFTAPAGEGDG